MAIAKTTDTSVCVRIDIGLRGAAVEALTDFIKQGSAARLAHIFTTVLLIFWLHQFSRRS